MFSSRNQVRIVDGHVVRNGSDGTSPASSSSDRGSMGSTFSLRRFLLVAIFGCLLVITNPANELRSTVTDFVYQIQDRVGIMINKNNVSGSGGGRQRELTYWAWQKILDPPISVTNYGIFTIEERNTKVVVLALTKSWSCNFYDERSGAVCNALVKNMCHGKPLVYDPKSLAYTAHRCICLLLISVALLSFFYCGQLPSSLTSEPILRAILTSVGRSHVSLVSLGLDLFNASFFVYPALVRIEKVIPMLKEGRVGSSLGLPVYWDFIFYVVVLVLFLGGGSNALTNYFFFRDPCFGFDSTVAAAVAYSHAFSSSLLDSTTTGTNAASILSPQTVFWGYLPVTALLGGPSHAVSWIVAGMFGVMLGQYHLDNQNLFLAVKQMIQAALR